jgi:cytochrome c551/c552
MNRRFGLATIAVAAFCGVAAYYGGWATVTVENLPDQLIAGQPYNMTFSIRQHGDNLLTDLTPRVELSSGGTDLTARAVATNKAGYYTATLNVPKSGEWNTTIQTSFGKSHLKLLPIEAVNAHARKAVSWSAPERGHRLFVAKGCVAGHQHAKVDGSGHYQVGPELTEKRFAADYLKKFLADPSIKPRTANTPRMPDLELNDSEINALIAFINADQPKRTAAAEKQ